ncbi:MAG: GAF domain-containing protein, partial [Burkholderiales bacterium]|nr:GAF domain-containing protein [Burkholderiales bacterium]
MDDLSATLLRSAIAAPDLDSCAAGVATELARALAADRVAVGVVARRFARVVALSHGAQLREQQSLAAQIGRAMDEALDQACSIQHPQHPSERARITLAHAELAARQGSAAVLTLPLFAGLQPVGALVLERTRAEPFDAATLQRLESLAASLAP